MKHNGIILVFLLLLNLTLLVSAQMSPSVISSPVKEIVCMLKDGLVNIAGALASLIFIISGLRYIWSMDDPSKRKAAKDSMVHAIVGLLIVATADTVITLIPGFEGC